MTLAQFTEPRLLVPRLLSDSRDSVIAELSSRLASTGRIEDAREFTLAALAHESFFSAVFDEVAFPLARGRAVKELSFAFGLSQPGIRWGGPKMPVVNAVMLFAVPLSADQLHLSLAVTFASFLQDTAAFAALAECVQPEEMFAALKQVRLRRTGPQPQVTNGVFASR